MKSLIGKAFWDLGEGDIETYAQEESARIGLVLPEACRAPVLANLAGLRDHARLMAAALGEAAARLADQDLTGAFEP